MVQAAIAPETVRPQEETNSQQEALTFRQFVELVNPKYRWYSHVIKLADALQRVADGEIKRLMVFMPPRHGKSELVSRLFAAYYLYRHPDQWVAIASYVAELAYPFSRAARDNYTRAGGTLKDDAFAVKHWETGKGGGLWAAGVGGPATGKGFHLGIIDDPIKNAEAAASETIRAKQKDWYDSTWYTREEPNGAQIVIQTRWNEDDLSGWLLAKEKEEEEPEGWHIISLEAIKEKKSPEFPTACTIEIDEREPGEALCRERYPLPRLNKIKGKIGPYFFGALYQQNPTPREGGFFKVSMLEIVRASPQQGQRVRWWDRGATADGGDYTVGLRMLLATNGEIYIEDVVRGQWGSGERDRIIRQTAVLDGIGVQQWTEQEPGSSGKDAAIAFVKLLAGYSAQYEVSTGDKVVRAGPLSSQVEIGNVKLVEGPWNQKLIEEYRAFPHGAHDDQVDGGSGAYNKLANASSVSLRWL